jgi:hypothetical protein
MGFGQDAGERRMGLTSHIESQYSSKKSGNGHHVHMDARSCQWMVVKMQYDIADNGRCNPDRRRENEGRRTRLTGPRNHQQKHRSHLPQHGKA